MPTEKERLLVPPRDPINRRPRPIVTRKSSKLWRARATSTASRTAQWGPESVDALKRFQADQNLMPDGKINSLSLIALGLGPKRLTAKSDAAPHAQLASRSSRRDPPK